MFVAPFLYMCVCIKHVIHKYRPFEPVGQCNYEMFFEFFCFCFFFEGRLELLRF